jgi:hypothetical protein
VTENNGTDGNTTGLMNCYDYTNPPYPYWQYPTWQQPTYYSYTTPVSPIWQIIYCGERIFRLNNVTGQSYVYEFGQWRLVTDMETK